MVVIIKLPSFFSCLEGTSQDGKMHKLIWKSLLKLFSFPTLTERISDFILKNTSLQYIVLAMCKTQDYVQKTEYIYYKK